MRKGRPNAAFLFLLTSLFALTATADAADFTLTVSEFGKVNGIYTGTHDIEGFRRFTKELGLTMSPKFFGPAETLGSMGFLVDYEISFTAINSDAEYWKKGAVDPSDTATTMQIHIRKGLPYSLEIGGVVTHLFKSRLWGIGLELKWALQEGFRYIPDIAVLFNVNTVLGNHELAMLTIARSVLISKSFGIAGLFTVTPYTGYNWQYVNSSTFPMSIYALKKNGASDWQNFVIPQQSQDIHIALIGFTLKATLISLGAEVMLTEGLEVYSTKVGLVF